MRNFILPAKGLAGFAMAVLILLGVESCTAYVVESFTKVAENVACTVRSANLDGIDVILELDCGGGAAYTSNSEAIVSHIRGISPLTCTLYKDESAKCRGPER